MQVSDAHKLLTYMAIWDNRVVDDDKARVWADGLPSWMTVEVAIAAARRFYTEPAKNESETAYLSSRMLVKYALDELRMQRELDERRVLRDKMNNIETLPAGKGRRRELPTGGLEAIVGQMMKGVDDAPSS